LQIICTSERDLRIVHVIEPTALWRRRLARWLLALWRLLWSLLWSALLWSWLAWLLRLLGLAALLTILLTLISIAQQLELSHNNVNRVLFNASLVCVLAVLDAAFDVERATLADVLSSNLCQPVIERDTVPLSVFGDFPSLLVFATATGS
jgi:hypothetical protein